MKRNWIGAGVFLVVCVFAGLAIGTCAGEAGNKHPHKVSADVVTEAQQPEAQSDVTAAPVSPAAEATTVTKSEENYLRRYAQFIRTGNDNVPCEEMTAQKLPRGGVVLGPHQTLTMAAQPDWPPPESALVDPALVRLGILEGEADARRVDKEMAERSRAYKEREATQEKLPVKKVPDPWSLINMNH